MGGLVLFVVAIIFFVVAAGCLLYAVLGKEGGKKGAIGALVGFLIVGLIFFGFAKIKTVPAGHQGVPIRLGEVLDFTMDEGFNWKSPVVSVYNMSVRTQEYTMSAVADEGAKEGDDSIEVLAKGGLKMSMEITILFHLDKDRVNEVYQSVGPNYVNVLVRPNAQDIVRDVASGYTPEQIYSENRDDVRQGIFDSLSPVLNARGIIIEGILLRDVGLPSTIQTAIENRQEAQINIEKEEFNIQVEEKKAAVRVAEARGIADAQKIIQETLTPAYLQWKWIEAVSALAESENTTFMITPFDQALIPQTVLDLSDQMLKTDQ